MIRKGSYESYWKVRSKIAPSLKYSQYFYEDIISRYVTNATRWLELGCGHGVLPSWRYEKEAELVKQASLAVGIDYDLPSLRAHRTITRRVRGDIANIPCSERAFDFISMNMVVEHLDNPERQFREINRVLIPGGVLVFHTPNALGYGVLMARLFPDRPKKKIVGLIEGRSEGDIFKTFYRANTRRQICKLASATGFRVVDIKMVATDAILATVPPLYVPELIWIRALMTRPLKGFRSNIIGVFEKISDVHMERTPV